MNIETYGSKSYMQRTKEQFFTAIKPKQGYKPIGMSKGYTKEKDEEIILLIDTKFKELEKKLNTKINRDIMELHSKTEYSS